jgi:hypothetical protein
MSYSDQPPQYGQQPYGAPAPQGTNKKAVWSLVTGILGVLCCGILSVIAIILGNSAKREIAQTREGGAGLATAGVVLGWVGIALLALNLILIATGNYYFEFDAG